MSVLGKIGAVGAGAGAGLAGVLSSVASAAGKGFLEGAIGRTAAAGFTAGVSGAKASPRVAPLSGDSGTDQIRALRDLQSDFADQKEILKDIQYDLSMTRETLGNLGVILVQSNMTLGKILDKLPGSFEKTVSNAVTGALAGAGIATGLGAAAAAGAAGAAALAKPSAAAASVAATNRLARGVGGRLPAIGGVLSGGMEYADSGNVAKSIIVGGGSFLGGLGGGALGSLAGPVGTVAGGVGGSFAGESAGRWLYDRFFGDDKEKSEKMAELEKKEEEKEKQKKEEADAVKESINFSSREIIFKADDIKFEMIGTTGEAVSSAMGGGGMSAAPSGGGGGGGGTGSGAGVAAGAGASPSSAPSAPAPAAPQTQSQSGSQSGGGMAASTMEGFMPPTAPSAGSSVAGSKSEPKSAGPVKAEKKADLMDLSGGGDIAGGGAMVAGQTTPAAPAAAPVKKEREVLKDLSGGITGEGAFTPGAAIEAMKPDISDAIRKSIEADNPGTQAPPEKVKPKPKSKTAAKVTTPAAGRVLAAGARSGSTDYQSNHMPVINPDGSINWGNPDIAADFFRADKAMRAMQAGGQKVVAQGGGKKKAAPKKTGIKGQAGTEQFGPFLPEQIKQVGSPAATAGAGAEFPGQFNDAFPVRPKTQFELDAEKFNVGEGGPTFDSIGTGGSLAPTPAKPKTQFEIDAEKANAGQGGPTFGDMSFIGSAPLPPKPNEGDRLMNASILAEQQMRDAIARSTTSPYTEGSVMPSQVTSSQPESSTNKVPDAMLDDLRLQSIFGFGA